MLVGLLRAYQNPNHSDLIAAMSVKELNGSAIFFNIHDVNFENKTIKVKRLINGTWKDGFSEFPDVVYNDLPQTSAYPYKLYRKLEAHGIPFTTHRLGVSKSDYTNVFLKNSEIQNHLIPTHQVQSAKEVLMYCEKYRKIALKPNFGHQGKGVKFVHLEENDNYTIYSHDKSCVTYEREQASIYIDSMLMEKKHHIQKKIESKVKKVQLPLILRSYVGRGINGKWFNLFNMVGIDYLGSSVVNLNQGSARTDLNTFLRVNYSEEEGARFKANLKRINKLITEEYQENFDFLIDSLGIDYAIDENNKIYIVEINGFPGTRPEVGKATYNMVRFAEYLYKMNKNGN